MTTEDLFDDMKQFINAKIDGVENRLDAKIDGVYHELKSDISELKADITELKSDISDLKSGLADIDTKLDTVMEAVGEDIVEIRSIAKKHEQRITKLEVAKAA